MSIEEVSRDATIAISKDGLCFHDFAFLVLADPCDHRAERVFSVLSGGAGVKDGVLWELKKCFRASFDF